MLLGQASGIGGPAESVIWHDYARFQASPEALIRELWTVHLKSAPWSRYEYSNVNYISSAR
jgi:hypothetical protein